MLRSLPDSGHESKTCIELISGSQPPEPWRHKGLSRVFWKQSRQMRGCCCPLALNRPFLGSVALGLVSPGGRIGSSAAITRADAAAAASSRRWACCCCSRVGGKAGSGRAGLMGVLLVRRTTASRRGRSGNSLAAHQRSAKRLPCRMLATGAFLVCHIFRVFMCRR